MTRAARDGAILGAGLALALAAGTAPAGLDGGPVPPLSWGLWGLVAVAATGLAAGSGRGVASAARSLLWLVPATLLFTLPALVFAAAARGNDAAAALLARALSSAAATISTVTCLGGPGVVRGLRALGVPARLVEVVHAMLVAFAATARRLAAMQRARAARRARGAPFASLVVAPGETLRGFGRLASALLLRSLERAEALERARRARGGARP